MKTLHSEQLFFFFFFYSFFGWIVETVYKSVTNGRFMNSGFLYGPFVPLYGFCALITISAEQYLAPLLPFSVRLGIYVAVATLLEYYTAMISEQIFGVRLWDYHDKKFNVHGRICLKYSFYWLLLNALQMRLIHPWLSHSAAIIPDPVLMVINRGLLSVMLIDFIFACRNLRSIIVFFNTLDKNYLVITREFMQKSIETFRRLIGNFPNLATYISENIRSNIVSDFNIGLKELFAKGFFREKNGVAVMQNGSTEEVEFDELTSDILTNPEFIRLREFRHHNGSIYDHVKAVAYLTYRFCRTKKLDYSSATRGALLHDFFLYDWRTGKDEQGKHHKGHIYLHPKMALENAVKNFSINDTERDIILNHMWPLSPSIPRYKETYIVSFIDKYVATREFIEMLKKSRRQDVSLER